jgi:glucosylceramidase
MPAFTQRQHGTRSRTNTISYPNIQVYTTAKGIEQKLLPMAPGSFYKAVQPPENEISVFVNPTKKYQTFMGFGGAITDAAAETFAKLPPEKQQELLDAYYNASTGIGYTLARTNIHSCDFSSESYTYITEADSSLKSFTIRHDLPYRIPLLKKANQATGGKLVLFASPWSPPAFMKDNNNMLQGGKLLPAFYQSWANYFTRFIKAYEKEGVPVWGITIQNEPMAKQSWESCLFSAEEERDFLKNFLGPTMQQQGLAAKKIIVWDHNRDLINYRANTIFNDPLASKYAWGIGFHWYETWSGSDPMYSNVAKVHEDFPDKNLLFTEGCAESFNPQKYDNWEIGEKYGRSIISDLNNNVVGWTDWNILLDEKGGPNHVGNFCFAPVHGNTQTGALIYTNAYYYIGHFSKFIRPGAKRISTACSRSQLQSTGFINTDNTIATIVLNTGDQPIPYNFISGTMETKLLIPPHAIQTLVYPAH